MKIILLDRNIEMTLWWRAFFREAQNVEVVCSDFIQFMKSTPVECTVSPANSFGLMDGGYDAAITEWFGEELQQRVQQHIIDELHGEQLVGTSFIIEIANSNQYLIHTPTMRTPQIIRDPLVIYNCMRSCLITAMENNIQSVVIPAFGAAVGQVPYNLVAELMYKAYCQINSEHVISWDYVEDHEIIIPD
jgi:O-acetyl-ADP-ribose deacetylase (regulator of RNase III)